ncbi:hypothetical protein GCM10029964_054680 [Kibdelosporangium lantanae]
MHADRPGHPAGQRRHLGDGQAHRGGDEHCLRWTQQVSLAQHPRLQVEAFGERLDDEARQADRVQVGREVDPARRRPRTGRPQQLHPVAGGGSDPRLTGRDLGVHTDDQITVGSEHHGHLRTDRAESDHPHPVESPLHPAPLLHIGSSTCRIDLTSRSACSLR